MATQLTKVTFPGGDYIDLSDIADKRPAVKNISGQLCSFNDGADLPMPKLEVAIEPVQDLHGYDSPWVGGAGKNKLPLSNDYTNTKNDITITVKNGILYVNGTSNVSTTDFYFSTFALEAGVYILSATKSGAATNLFLKIGNNYINEGQTFTLNEDSNCSAFLRCYKATYNNASAACMIRLASVSDATFAPYSNECPISGWDECNVAKTGKNLYKAELNNYYLDVSTGQPVAQAGYEVSEYIPIQSGQSIYIPASGTSRRWVYDKYKNPKTYLNNSDAQTYTAQEDGYIRLTLNKTISAYSTFQVEYGNQATTYEPYNGSTYTIQFTDGSNPLTVYGGYVDIVSGVLTIDRAMVDLGALSWEARDTHVVRASISVEAKYASKYTAVNGICSAYLIVPQNDVGNGGIGFNTETQIYLCDLTHSFSTSQDAQQYLNGQKLVYELATPQNIQLTPTQVKSLLGENRVWADTGDILDAEYVTSKYDGITAKIAEYVNWTGIYNKPTTYAPTIGTTATTALAGDTKYAGASTAGGAATSAIKATQDSDGNAINSTYLKLSGGTMTGTIITPADDSKGLEPATRGYGTIGKSNKYYCSSFVDTMYGTALRIAKEWNTLNTSYIQINTNDINLYGTNNTWNGTNTSLKTALASVVTYQDFKCTSASVPANASKEFASVNVAKTGYIPIGYLKYNTGDASIVVVNQYLEGNNAILVLRNVSSTAKSVAPTFRILYMKTTS